MSKIKFFRTFNKRGKFDSIFEKLKIDVNNKILEVYDKKRQDCENNEILKIIWKDKSKQFGKCSREIHDILNHLYSIGQNERFFVHEEWKNLLNYLKRFSIIWVIRSAYYILCTFFIENKRWKRLINIWENINYKWSDNDTDYLKYIIRTISDPEKKSLMTYFLSKIKDVKVEKKLKKLGKNPTQFDLLLQQCRKGQIMLTNALDLDGSSWFFRELTQAISGSRWCHSLIVSDIIKDKNWLIKDLKIIQSTLDGGVHEISFKKYIKENYSKSDFLVASFPRSKTDSIVLNAKNHIWQKYDRLIMILDVIFWWDTKLFWKNVKNINKTYCTALVFDAMKKSGCEVPFPHVMPADILLSNWLTPEYACYCDKF